MRIENLESVRSSYIVDHLELIFYRSWTCARVTLLTCLAIIRSE